MIQHERNENVNFINKYLHSRRYEYLKSFLRNQFGSRQVRILEIGVGHGRLFAELNEVLQMDYTGIEFVAEFYQAAREKYEKYTNFKLIQGSILDVNLQNSLDRNYDVVIALETFEHIHARNIPTVFDLFRNQITCSLFITSVPIEIGFTILIKNFGSYLMHYPRYREYSYSDNFYSLLKQVHKIKPHSGDNVYPKHKGFDWRFYRYLLHQDFSIAEVFHLPIKWFPEFLSTNMLFITTPREKIRS